MSSVLDGQKKALEYVVRQPASTVYTDEEEKQEPHHKAESIKGATATTNTMYGFSMLTYEEAQKELEACAPAFTAKKQGLELPFETQKTQERVKGFIPMEEIGEYIPPENAKPPRKTKKTAEDLQKMFPDLYFKRTVFELRDPAFEQSQEQPEVDPFAENKRYLEELDKKNKQNKIEVSTCVYAGKLFNTYLMYERGDEVYVIDQHAAHERLIFNRLKERMQQRSVPQQPMLVPYELSMNVFEKEFVKERLADIQEMGFELIENGENGFAVSAIPLDLQNINLSDISGYRAIRLEEILKDRLASAACKAAVKGGMDLTREEIDALFALMDGDMGLKCPHGRPVVVKLTKTELEKMFKRIV